MGLRYVIKENISKLLLRLLLFCIPMVSLGQTNSDCSKVIDQEPYFVHHKVVLSDSLFQRDVRILKHCGNFDSVESELLKSSVLTALMNEQVNAGKPATYRTIIDFINTFKKTQEYEEFRDGVVLYRTLENKKVNLKDWESDQKLFIRMGFTQNDLDDFKEYIAIAPANGLTYKEAYLSYIKALEEPPKRDQ
jgi:hypothetical protein